MAFVQEIAILTVLVALSGFFSASETALFSLSRLRVRYLIKKGVHGAHAVEKLKEDPQGLLIVILIGNNVVNVAASALATVTIAQVTGSYAIGITTGIMTLLLLVFGEITPKSLAIKHSQRIALWVARPLLLLKIVLFPLVFIFKGLTTLLSRSTKKAPLVTEEELKTFVSICEEIGQIKESERRMIHQIFHFDDRDVKAIMTLRSKIIAVPEESTIKEAAHVLHTKKHTKLPIYKSDLDHIRGYLHILDAQKAIAEGRQEEKVTSIMRPMLFVPETKKLDALLKRFQEKLTNVAIVRDEAHKTVGLVTMEDVLEEIVGEIMEEHEGGSPVVNLPSKPVEHAPPKA